MNTHKNAPRSSACLVLALLAMCFSCDGEGRKFANGQFSAQPDLDGGEGQAVPAVSDASVSATGTPEPKDDASGPETSSVSTDLSKPRPDASVDSNEPQGDESVENVDAGNGAGVDGDADDASIDVSCGECEAWQKCNTASGACECIPAFFGEDSRFGQVCFQ